MQTQVYVGEKVRFFSSDDTLLYMAGEGGLRQRGRRFAPVVKVRAKPAPASELLPSFLATDAVEK